MTSVCDWSVCTVSLTHTHTHTRTHTQTRTHTLYTNIPGFNLQVVYILVPLYSLIVTEEELMNVAESSLRTGEETGEKRHGQKPWRGGVCVCARDGGGGRGG